jgi:hypothetical protein
MVPTPQPSANIPEATVYLWNCITTADKTARGVERVRKRKRRRERERERERETLPSRDGDRS